MRYAKRVDANQAAIVEAFRACGFTVHDFSGVGHGCPDLAVEKGAAVYWVEVKDGSKIPSARKLTTKERLWGELLTRSGIAVEVVTSVEDVLKLAKARV